MSEHIEKVVQEFQAKLEEHERQARDLKRIINTLRQHAGHPPLYPDAELESQALATTIRSDQFYGQPLSKAVREILVTRKAANLGPATVAEVYQTLLDGGYKFDTSDPENAKRNLRISLTKNSATFHKLPNGKYGLLEWYPAAKEQKPRQSSGNGSGARADETPEESEDTEGTANAGVTDEEKASS